ncbi:MAG: hypothetical protein GY749_30880 [Desulfobacteraceae bacterium]|nr:hypothetical protein [Desulfobacteraceae bacterium]
MTEPNELNEIFSMISSMSTTVKNLKPMFDIVKAVPTGKIFAKKHANEFQDKLSVFQDEIIRLQDDMDSFEKKSNDIIGKLGQLIRSYSEIVSEVKFAKGKADKVAEIFELSPGLVVNFTSHFANGARDDFERINSGMEKLPDRDSIEVGSIKTKFGEILYLLNKLEPVRQENEKLIEIFKGIARHYSDVASLLSRHLRKILDSFNISM